MKPTTMLYPQPDGDGRRGDDPRLSARRAWCCSAGCDKTVPGAADGRGQRRRAGDHASPAARAEPARYRGRRARRSAPTSGATPSELRAGRITRRVSTRSSRPQSTRRPATATRWARPRRWPRWPRRSGMTLPGRGRDPGRRRAALRRWPRRPAARAVELAWRGPAALATILTAGGVRQRDHVLHGARRLDQRRHPPARARRPRRRASCRSSASTSSPRARRCSPTCGPPAST